VFRMRERVRSRHGDDGGDVWEVVRQAIEGDGYYGDYHFARVSDRGTEPGYIIRNSRTGDRQWVLGFELERA
jgi:hypothetical protein